ncbi:MAG TPA: N-acetyl-1-D-myo-inositol-2-amino-2-deoxy-alpha-D-glucopyranoside deacetylase, partial [Candidatus Lustribacter sp.]|nr:N-acetyl-1-D-myo-inositol-2-amino-2-deoxy-alpha-D-glucopyranoside deacetylase [Candidatus Lustribacter sp.]
MTPVSPAPADRPARLLFVHAHPDDETLTCGTAMAHYARAGHEVVVLTCTLGEEGEVIPPELAHLASDRCDTLGPWRREELREAMTRLGVRHAVLGEDRACGVLSRYRDSGMAGSPAAARPGAWVNADPDEAADLIGAHIRGVRPDVVVTYDEHGGYRHPDHVQTHRMTVRAVASLREHERPARLALVLTPQSWAREDRAWLRAHVPPGAGLTLLGDDAPYPALVVPDEVVTHAVADPAAVPAQARALAAHRTQVTVFDGYYALSN